MLLFLQILILTLVLGTALYLVWRVRKKERDFLSGPNLPPKQAGPTPFEQKLEAANQRAIDRKKNQNLT